ncbi:MAG: heme-binding protein [Verrucomicrobiales bacterium]|nr:heme-binding protein [Verrucomicrobiales bacterium]
MAQTPSWIWHDLKPSDNEVRFFGKSFSLGPVKRADIIASADDELVLLVNGTEVGKSQSWRKPVRSNITRLLKDGPNLIVAKCRNVGGSAGFIARIEITGQDNQKTVILSDNTWVSLKNEKTPIQDGSSVVQLAKLGDEPWGNVFAAPGATTAESLKVLPGFKVELLRSAAADEGSWVSMTIDPKGRFIVSPQDGGLLRMTVSEGGKVEVEHISDKVGWAMGLLYAYDSLYISGKGPEGLGLYRMKVGAGGDELGQAVLLRKFPDGAGEHGSHALVLGPDGKIYFMNGNFVKVPADVSPYSQHKHYADDHILPRANDGNGFGNGLKPPGGFLLRMDKDAKEVELFASGFRNTYDFGFNTDGEIFGFDSDMEWDWGNPWYRPTRINHIVSGADFGFREGSGKWPNWYPDSLPTTLDIGIGSPTGVKFGTGAKFPAKYQKAMFAMDWAYGRLFAIHLAPKGSTYEATSEVFIQGKPLNLTDMEIGKDGALYFLVGGRGTQAGLYRVTYTGSESTAAVQTKSEGQEARKQRHQLETFHGRPVADSLNTIWAGLKSEDRWIRYAARIALESQDPAIWAERAISETDPRAGITALLALTRTTGKQTQEALLKALAKYPLDSLDESLKLEKLRVIELSFIRQGKPSEELRKLAIEKLDKQFPAKSYPMNRELCQLLIYLEAPGVVGKTLDLLASAPTQEEQLTYVVALRNLKTGWTIDQRKQYFAWFSQDFNSLSHPATTLAWFKAAGRDYGQGSSFRNFIESFRKDAVASLSDDQRGELAPFIVAKAKTAPKVAKTRTFVKDWKMDDFASDLEKAASGRNYEIGKEVFTAAQCFACHRFGSDGGAVGPDLTAVSSRFNTKDLLESILDPSKVVSEQYQNTNFNLKNGDDITGRPVEENDQTVFVVVNPLTTDRVAVKKSDIKQRQFSKASPMPEGLLSIFSKNEILDLLAYVSSGGKPTAPAFSK